MKVFGGRLRRFSVQEGERGGKRTSGDLLTGPRKKGERGKGGTAFPSLWLFETAVL